MGRVYDSRGNDLGRVDHDGSMYDSAGNYMGRIEKDGYVYDAQGEYKASIWSNGHIYMNGSYIGLIDSNGDVYRDSCRVGHIDGWNMKTDASESPASKGSSNDAGKSPAIKGSSNDKSGKKRSGGGKVGVGGFVPSTPSDSRGCLPTLVVGTLLFVALIYVVVYVVAIGAMIAAAVGLVALVALVIYELTDAIMKGEFKKKSGAKAISVISSLVLIGCVALVLYNSGKINQYIDPNVNATNIENLESYSEDENSSDDYEDDDYEDGNYENDSNQEEVYEDDINDDLFVDKEPRLLDEDTFLYDERFYDIDDDITPLVYNGHVYGIFNFDELALENYDECKKYCEAVEGYLAVIDDQTENDVIYQYLKENDREHTFFGYSDENEEGNWEWTDGSSGDYENWAEGQPNNKNGDEDYAQFSGDDEGTWNDAEFGSGSWRILCEWDSE